MIATILIEIGMAGWVLTRYSLNQPRRIILAILIGLAGFQIAEYGVCTGAEGTLIWSRLGYVLITLLPALGLHLISTLNQNQGKLFVWITYAGAIALATTLAFVPSTLNQAVCTGNYTIFKLSEPFRTMWVNYYSGAVLLGIILSTVSASFALPSRRRPLKWLALGYAGFILPTLIIYHLLPQSRAGIPSIMCGFAVILAIILGLKVAPLIPKN